MTTRTQRFTRTSSFARRQRILGSTTKEDPSWPTVIFPSTLTSTSPTPPNTVLWSPVGHIVDVNADRAVVAHVGLVASRLGLPREPLRVLFKLYLKPVC